MRFPTLNFALLAALCAHPALARVDYSAVLSPHPDAWDKYCLMLTIVDDYGGSKRITVATSSCDSFSYPGEDQLAWDLAGSYDWYYAKVKAHHRWLIAGLGVTYGTDHGTGYFDIEMTPTEGQDGWFHGSGSAL